MMLMIMSKVKMYLAIAFVLLSCSQAYAGGWQRLEIGANVSQTRAIAIAPDNPDIIYIGSQKGLYQSIDKGVSLLRASTQCRINVRGISTA